MDISKFEKLPNMTVKQSVFIQALAVGINTQEACRLAKISYPTGYKWKKEDGFDSTLIKLKSDIVNCNLSRLLNALNIAVDKHVEVLVNPHTKISQRLKAIDMLYNQVHWFTETEDIQQRMCELEKLYSERNK